MEASSESFDPTHGHGLTVGNTLLAGSLHGTNSLPYPSPCPRRLWGAHTGGDTIILTSISTGTSIPLVAVYYTGTKTVRAIQVGTPQNITMDVRFAVIPAV